MMKRIALVLLLLIAATTLVFAASITVTWTNAWLSDALIANTIDDQVNALSTAIQEREQNGGRYWPSSNDAKSGMNAVGSTNYVTGEWSVYESDLATKAVTVTDTSTTILSPTTLSSSLSVGSTLAVTGNSTFTGAITASNNLTVSGTFSAPAKRYLTVINDGALNTNNPNLDQEGFIVPQTITAGVMKEWSVISTSASTGTGSVQLRVYTPVWTSDKHIGSCSTGGSVVATLTPGIGYNAYRTTTFGNPNLLPGDEICFTRTGAVANYSTSTILIEVPW